MAGRLQRSGSAALWVGGALAFAVAAVAFTFHAARPWRPEIPRVWDEAALDGWATSRGVGNRVVSCGLWTLRYG
jgi:hypothetical protein